MDVNARFYCYIDFSIIFHLMLIFFNILLVTFLKICVPYPLFTGLSCGHNLQYLSQSKVYLNPEKFNVVNTQHCLNISYWFGMTMWDKESTPNLNLSHWLRIFISYHYFLKIFLQKWNWDEWQLQLKLGTLFSSSLPSCCRYSQF